MLRKRRERGGAEEDFAGHKCERDAVEDDVEAQAAGGAAGGRMAAGRWWQQRRQHAAMRVLPLASARRRTHTNVCRLSM